MIMPTPDYLESDILDARMEKRVGFHRQSLLNALEISKERRWPSMLESGTSTDWGLLDRCPRSIRLPTLRTAWKT